MKVSTKGRYALRAMIDLARHGDGRYVALGEISERQGISVKYLEQIVPALTRAGLLLSARGPQGGYRLARPAEQYTAGDILRVTEGNLAPVACLLGDPPGCPRAGNCSTLGFWRGLGGAIDRYVDGVTLASLARHGS